MIVRRQGPRGFADFSECGRYRYLLGRIWDDGALPLVWVMLNPSKADEKDDDATIRRCIGFARRRRYGGIIVANLYALIATNPRELVASEDPVGRENDPVLESIVEKSAGGYSLLSDRYEPPPGNVVAAWGASVGSVVDVIRAEQWTQQLMRTNPMCLGKTANGQPRHPLRLAYQTAMVPL